MASYCTRADILEQLPADVLLSLTDDDGDGQEDAGLVDAAISSASDRIDGYCGVRYPVPFEPTPGIVRGLCVDLAIWNLFSRRGFDADSADRTVVERYKAAVRFLERVNEGKAAIGTGSEEPHQPPAKVTVASRAQVFTEDLMDRF